MTLSNGSRAGIVGYGAYLPRRRLSRSSIVAANRWFNSGLQSYSAGERTMCGWDEDSLTMAVEAGRDCLGEDMSPTVETLVFASTSAPFADRPGSGIAAAALGFPGNTFCFDASGSRRAGTSALIAASRGIGNGGTALVLASDHRRTKAGSVQELTYGDGAAAILLGMQNQVAEILFARQENPDFLDQFRGANEAFDYGWEDRWIREEGYLKLVPDIVRTMLERTGLPASAVDRFILPCSLRNAANAVAKKCGLDKAILQSALDGMVGDTGAAHALVMLTQALEEAKPGETIVLIGWGQGCDCLLLRTTDRIAQFRPKLGLGGHLRDGRSDDGYMRFLSFNDIVIHDRGMRSEFKPAPGLSAYYREQDLLLGLWGGICRKCQTGQLPRTRYCVNPNCRAVDSQDPYRFADRPAHLQSWTADNLTFSPDPPAYFGMVVFDEGGRFMSDIVDVDSPEIAAGSQVQMVFRVHHKDPQNGYIQYFWKARPKGKAVNAAA